VEIVYAIALLLALDVAAWRWGVNSSAWAEDETRRPIRPLPRRTI